MVIAKGGVTKNLLQRGERSPTHHVPAGERVAQVVEVEVFELGSRNGILERLTDTARPPHPALVGLREPRQRGVDGLPHGYLAALA